MKYIIFLFLFFTSENSFAQYEDSFTELNVVSYLVCKVALQNVFKKDENILADMRVKEINITDSLGKTTELFHLNTKGQITKYIWQGYLKTELTYGYDYYQSLFLIEKKGADIYTLSFDNFGRLLEIENSFSKGKKINTLGFSYPFLNDEISFKYENYLLDGKLQYNDNNILTGLEAHGGDYDVFYSFGFKFIYFNSDKTDSIYASKSGNDTYEKIFFKNDSVSIYAADNYIQKKYILKNSRILSKTIRQAFDHETADVTTEYFYRKNGLIDYKILTAAYYDRPIFRNKFKYHYNIDE